MPRIQTNTCEQEIKMAWEMENVPESFVFSSKDPTCCDMLRLVDSVCTHRVTSSNKRQHCWAQQFCVLLRAFALAFSPCFFVFCFAKLKIQQTTETYSPQTFSVTAAVVAPAVVLCLNSLLLRPNSFSILMTFENNYHLSKSQNHVLGHNN